MTTVLGLVLGTVTWTSTVLPADISKPGGYPTRTIELVVPWGVGGGSDQFARALAPLLERRMGVSIAIVNKPGANGTVGLNHVVSQRADGYTIALVTNDLLANNVAGTSRLGPDDFTWVARGVADVEMLLARADDSRFRTFDDYVAYAKRNPGRLTIAVAGEGGLETIAAALVNHAAGVEVKYVPFDKAAERYAAFLGAHTDLLIEEPSDMLPYIKEGKARPLLQLLEDRSSTFPDVPTAREKGADVTLGLWRGIAVKKGTPPEITRYLEAVLKDALADPAFVEGYAKKRSLDIRPGFLAGKEFTDAVTKEHAQIREALKLLGGK